MGKSLRKICAADDMPGLSTVMEWLQKFPDFAEQYTRARELQADTHADEIVDIADDAAADPDAASRRVRVEARKWVASKLKPKTYGDRTAVEHSGAVSLAVDLSALTPEQLRTLASIPLTGE